MTPVTYILLAVIVAVVLIDLYLKRKNKLATTKEIEKVIDKDSPEKPWWKNKVVIITPSILLLFLLVGYYLYYVPKSVVEAEYLYLEAVDKALEIRDKEISFGEASLTDQKKNKIYDLMEEPIELSNKAIKLLNRANYLNYFNPEVYNNLAYNYFFLEKLKNESYYVKEDDMINGLLDNALKIDSENIESLKLKHIVFVRKSQLSNLPAFIRDQDFLVNFLKDELRNAALNGGFSFTLYGGHNEIYSHYKEPLNFDCISIDTDKFFKILDEDNNANEVIKYAKYIANKPDDCEPMLRCMMLYALCITLERINSNSSDNNYRAIYKNRSHAKSRLEFGIKAYEINDKFSGNSAREEKHFDKRTFYWANDLLPVYLVTTKRKNSYASKSYYKAIQTNLLTNIAYTKYSLNINMSKNNYYENWWEKDISNRRKTHAEDDITSALVEINSQIRQETLDGNRLIAPKSTLYFYKFLILRAMGDWAAACAAITMAAEEDKMWLEDKLSYCK